MIPNLTKTIVWISVIIAIATAQMPRTDHWYERNEQFNSELDSIPEGKVVLLGNSITEGFDLVRFFPGAELINRGIAGDHLDGVLERIENSATKLKPKRMGFLTNRYVIKAGTPKIQRVLTLPGSSPIACTVKISIAVISPMPTAQVVSCHRVMNFDSVTSALLPIGLKAHANNITSGYSITLLNRRGATRALKIPPSTPPIDKHK